VIIVIRVAGFDDECGCMMMWGYDVIKILGSMGYTVPPPTPSMRTGAVVPPQCCQVAEFPAKKLKRGRKKNGWPEKFYCRILAEFCKKWPKRGRKFIFVNV